MSEWPMRGHFRHLHFNSFQMIKVSGVLKDSQIPISRVWISSSHFPQSKVATFSIMWVIVHQKFYGPWFVNNSHEILFISSYGIKMNVIHLLVWFEHKYRVHCLNMNVICIFKLFKHGCCMSIRVVYTWKLWT
jgi:hypothetical protein